MADPNAIRAGKAVVELSGDDSKLKAATQRSQKYLQDLGKAGKEVNSAANGGFFERMALRARQDMMEDRASGENALERALSSKQGMTGLVADSLGIGLQAVVAQAIGGALRSATEQAVTLKEQLRQGKITEEELYRGLATGIPILGDFVAGFLNIRELVTGERAEIERINAEMKRGEAAMNAKVRAAELYRDILRQITTEAARAASSAKGIGADEYSKEQDAIEQARRELEPRKLDLDAGISKRADEYYAAKQKELEAAEQKVKEAQAKREAELDKYRSLGSVNAKAKQRYEEAPDYLAAKAERDRLRKEANEAKAKIIAEEKNALAEQENLLGARERENANRRTREYAQAYADAQRTVDAAMAAGAAQRLRTRGKEHEAELELLQSSLEQQLAAIDKAEQDRLKKFGLKPGDQQYDEVTAQAATQRQAARGDHGARVEAADVKEYERAKREALELRQLQNDAIKDRQLRELTALDDRYEAEIDAAEFAGRETFQVRAKWDQARRNLEEQHLQEAADRGREEALRLQQIQLQGIENRNARELAAIDARYQAEMDRAKAHPGERDTASIQAQWDAERVQTQRRQAIETADAVRAIDLEIERERTAIQKRGMAERLAQLEIERREALRREADERTTTGVGAERINELYDLKRERELMLRGSSAGSFSAAELSRMGGNGALDDIAKHTKDTAENTRRMADSDGLRFGA